jgi:kinetochore protein NDC80
VISLKELVEKRNSYATDLEQFQDLIQQMDEHVAMLNQKKEDRTKDLEETNEKLAKVTAHVKELKEKITNQELSVEDVKKIQNERKGVEEATDRAIALRDERRSALWEIESEVERLWNEIESLVCDYNSTLGELNLLPLVSSEEVEMKAVLDKNSVLDSDPTKLLGVDLHGVVQNALSSFREEYTTMSSDCKWKYQESLDNLEQSEEAFTEAMERNRIVERKIDKCEETMEAERETLEAKLAIKTREAESMETKVASLRDPVALEEQMAKFERQCAELEAMRQQHEEDYLARKKAVCEEIDKACQAMEEYDQFCLKKIDEVHQYKKEKRAKYRELKLPTTVPGLSQNEPSLG